MSAAPSYRQGRRRSPSPLRPFVTSPSATPDRPGRQKGRTRQPFDRLPFHTTPPGTAPSRTAPSLTTPGGMAPFHTIPSNNISSHTTPSDTIPSRRSPETSALLPPARLSLESPPFYQSIPRGDDPKGEWSKGWLSQGNCFQGGRPKERCPMGTVQMAGSLKGYSFTAWGCFTSGPYMI